MPPIERNSIFRSIPNDGLQGVIAVRHYGDFDRVLRQSVLWLEMIYQNNRCMMHVENSSEGYKTDRHFSQSDA
jgi:hypothetical protein